MEDSDPLREGQRVGPFQIVRVIGAGGMGVVYEALQVDLDTRVALKTLSPALSKDEEARERFLREGKAASRTEHPNVVRVLGCGTEGDFTYLVMELLRGETLAQLLAREQRLDVERALEILLPIMSAMALGHDRGVVHRDLKPQNIFLSRGYRGELVPKVLDFGVSKLVDSPSATLTLPSTVLGTAAYMSPEQALGLPVDARSDQYAIGLILYEMLTGRRAIAGANQYQVLHAAAAAQVVPAEQVDPSLAPGVAAVLSTLLQRAPENRYPSIRAAGALLLPMGPLATRMLLAADFPSSVPSPSASSRSQKVSSPPAAAGYTLLLPQSVETPPSTLGRAAAEIERPRPERSRKGTWIAAAGIACALGGVIAFKAASSSTGEAPPLRGNAPSAAAQRDRPPIETSTNPLGDRSGPPTSAMAKPAAAPQSAKDVTPAAVARPATHAAVSPARSDSENTEPADNKKHRQRKDGGHRKELRVPGPSNMKRGANGSFILD